MVKSQQMGLPTLSAMPPSPALTPGQVHAQFCDEDQAVAPGGWPRYGHCLTAARDQRGF